MNRLSKKRRAQVVAALVEGDSIRATVRMTGVAKNTVVKLLGDVGRACESYHDRYMRDLRCKRIQCDEIWSFCCAKQKNLPQDKRGQFGYGDVWTWVALDANQREARPGPHFHQLCRAAEPHSADGHAAVHPADQRILEEN